MGLSDNLYNSLKKSFDTSLNDAVKTIILRKKNDSFDPATNSVSSNDLDYNTRGIVAKYELAEINNNSIEPNDIKVIVLQNELSVEPFMDDEIIYNGDAFKIVSAAKDPADTIWEIQCRK